jgi:hypothetical protein
MNESMLFRFLVEGRGPKLFFFQVLVAKANSEQQARKAIRGFLASDGMTLIGFDEEETAVVDESVIPDEFVRPADCFGIVAASGRIWVDPEVDADTRKRDS